MKTLKEKRQELNNIIDKFAEMNNFEDSLKLSNTIKFLIKEQEEEFVKEILKDIESGKWNLRDVKAIIKQNSGLEE